MQETSLPPQPDQHPLPRAAFAIAGIVLFGFGVLAGRAMSPSAIVQEPAATPGIAALPPELSVVQEPTRFRVINPGDCLNSPEAMTTIGMAECWNALRSDEKMYGDMDLSALREGFERMAANPNDPSTSPAYGELSRLFIQADDAWVAFENLYCPVLSGRVSTSESLEGDLGGSAGVIEDAACRATLAGLRRDLLTRVGDRWFGP